MHYCISNDNVEELEDDFTLDIPCTYVFFDSLGCMKIINTSSSGESPVFGLATIEERDEGQSLRFLSKTLSPVNLFSLLFHRAYAGTVSSSTGHLAGESDMESGK